MGAWDESPSVLKPRPEPVPAPASPDGQGAMTFTSEQLSQIQELGEYRAATKALKAPAIGAIIFGALAIVGGYEGLKYSSINGLLLGVGALMLVVGVWSFSRPSLAGVAANAVMLIVVGLWNVGISLYEMQASHVPDPSRWIFAGVLQIAWGVQSLGKHRKLRGRFPQEPPEETVRFIDELVKSVRQLKPKKAEQAIEFTSRAFLGQARKWRGLLLDDAAVFVTKAHEVLCAAKDEVSLSVKGKRARKRTCHAVLQVGAVTHKGTISRASRERFSAWKEAPADVAGPEMHAELRSEGGAGESTSSGGVGLRWDR
jgi:hypothetical protein